MNIALEMAGFSVIPGDSEIFHPGDNIKSILFGIDIWDEDVSRAKELGVDLVISHHPPNLTPGKRFAEV
ncbi:MAG: Nif3-like dinuclear metal center hexameric protein, partial [Actinobacteria bacterium]|nr:Nif3-like dinuclear metal center hexameric protein [Actinomycetota bacterium]